MIIRNVIETPANKYGNAVFCGVLAIHIQRKTTVDSYTWSCIEGSQHGAMACLNNHLLKWMKEKLNHFVNQREQALTHLEVITSAHRNAIFHLRNSALKQTQLPSFCQTFLKNWEDVELLLPSEDSRFAHWRTVMKQLFHTCTREIQPTITNQS